MIESLLRIELEGAEECLRKAGPSALPEARDLYALASSNLIQLPAGTKWLRPRDTAVATDEFLKRNTHNFT